MLNNTTWKKIMTGALAFTLVSGVAVPVLSTVTPVVQAAEAGITPFTDVPAGLYAEKHIYRLSLQQIVRGYENKTTGEFTFKYNNTISQEEAIIMALRFAGLERLVDKNQFVVFQDNFYVKEDYKPYIELAFNVGILDRNEEYSIAAADPDTKWGSKAATREWVTKLIINALGASEKAIESANKSTSFTDNNEIDSKYIGYVNAAVELGLIKGYTETTFAPKAAINRASFATILSRAQKDFPVQVEGQHFGIITALSDNSITIYEDGTEKTYSIDKSTGFYSNDSDYAVEKSKFELFTAVGLIEINGQAKFLETLGAERYVEESVAPILLVNPEEKIIYIRVDNNPVAIAYDDKVSIVDSTGKKLAVTDLKEKDNIKIVRDTFRTTPQIVSIELLTEVAPATTTISGTFFSYDKATNLVTIKTEKQGLVSKIVVKAPMISIPYVKNASIEDLISNGDKVTLTMNSKDEVIDITVPSTEFKAIYLPKIVDYDPVKEQVTVLDASGYKAETLFFTEGTRYLLDGMLVDNKYVKDPLGSSSLVLRYVEVEGKKQIVFYDLLSEIEAYIESMDYYEKVAKVRLPDGTIAEIDYSNASIESLTKASPAFLDIKEGMNVMLELSTTKREITGFRLYETYQLSISSINSISKSITFKKDNESYVVLYDEAQFVDANGKPLAFSELKTNKNMIVGFYGKRIARVISL